MMELALNQLDEVVCLETTDTYCEYRLKIDSEEEWLLLLSELSTTAGMSCAPFRIGSATSFVKRTFVITTNTDEKSKLRQEKVMSGKTVIIPITLD